MGREKEETGMSWPAGELIKGNKGVFIVSFVLILLLSFLLIVPPFIEFYCIFPPVLRRPPAWYSTILAPQIFLRDHLLLYDVYWLTVSYHLQVSHNAIATIKPSLFDSYSRAKATCYRAKP
jgi:hypothetical protein